MPAFVMLLLFLSACAFTPSDYSVTDILLYGTGERQTIFYGKLASGQSRTIQLENNTITLSGTAPVGDLALPDALTVNGGATLVAQTKPLREVVSVAGIPLSSDLSVLARENVQALYFFDGKSWFDVGSRGDLQRNSKLRLEITPRQGLRGVGALNNNEADALQGYLQNKHQQPLAVALLEYPNIPDSYLPLSPRPDTYNLTALYVQVGLPLDLLGGFANPEPLAVRTLQAGANSAYSDTKPLLRWDIAANSFAVTWQLLNGNQIPLPSLPNLEFKRMQVVSFFMGQKPTGGFGVSLAAVRVERGTLTLRYNLATPIPGRVVTQALTSPFLSLQIMGNLGFSRVVALDNATGAVLAQLEQPSR
ncbi:MAG: protease complex subunit PrcB family protein [Deinococcales bacterium]